MYKKISPKQEYGFTLIEALVTVIVMSVGMLGLAALQNTSIKFTYDSYLRTQSSLLASDLFDRMRANPSVNYDNIDETTSTDCAETTANCNPNTLMQYDLTQWRAQRDQVFGVNNSTTTMIDTVAPFEEYTITFLWDSRTSDGDVGDGTEDGRQTVSYTARVK